MRFIPRKEEVDEVVEILEDDSFTSAEDMAKVLIAKVADLLWYRDWTIIGYNRGGESMAFGPFANAAEAKSMAAKLDGVALPASRWALIPMHGLGRTQANLEGGKPGGGYEFCCNCNCPAWAHKQDGPSRGQCIVCGREEGEPDWKCPKYESGKVKKKAPPKKREMA